MAREKQRNASKTRQRILDAAASLLIHGGVAALKINDLAAKADIGKPLIYRYFGNLDGVFTALVNDRAKRALEKLKQSPMPESVPVSKEIYGHLMFGRLLAFDECLRCLFRSLLAGQCNDHETRTLLGLVPGSDENDARDAAARAFLLGGVGFLVLLQGQAPSFAGAPIETPNDMAKFEAVFVELAGTYFKA